MEIIRCQLNLDSDNQMKLFNRSVPNWVQNGYKYIGLFGFGAACSQLATDIGKYSIGRLRPHFFDVSIKLCILLNLLSWTTIYYRKYIDSKHATVIYS